MPLTNFYTEEEIPAFESHGKKEVTIAYGATTIARFEKPIVNHKLSHMFQNHKLKINRRFDHFIAWNKTPSPIANVIKLLALSKACAQRILFARAIRWKHLWLCGD